MITKMQICVEGKIIMNKFSINQYDNKIQINSLDCHDRIIKVPIYNQFNGVDYISICFPLTMIIINKKILNPYIILSSFNFKTDNDIDFFKCLETFVQEKFNYQFISFNDLISDQFKNFNIKK